MRSLFRSVALIGLMAALSVTLAGCPSEGDDDDDGGYVCGDGVCEVVDGENQFNCSEDCASEEPCGDGFCSPNDGENASNCPADCQSGPVCGNGVCEAGENGSNCLPDCQAASCGDGMCASNEDEFMCFADCNDNCGAGFPVDCPTDDLCWSAGTNCSSNTFICNGPRRCANTADTAFCCANVFVECPGFAPFFCPQDGLCYAQQNLPGYCNATGCSLILGDC